MPLSDDEKSDAIRHMRYPIIGLAQSGPQGQNFAMGDAGFRFFDPMGSLLYRLNQCSPVEEAKLTGKPYASLAFAGLDPVPGDSVSATISGKSLPAPITATVVVPPYAEQLHGRWSLQTIAAALAQAFIVQTPFQQSGFNALAPFGAIPWAQAKIPTPTLAIIGLSGECAAPFKISTSFTGTVAPQIQALGNFPSPYMSFAQVGGNFILYGYIPILNYLESAWLATTRNLSVSEANNTVLRGDELDQRRKQHCEYTQDMCRFLGIPLDPYNPADRGGGLAVC